MSAPYDHAADLGSLAPIPAVYGYGGVLLSICFFQSVTQLVLRVGCPRTVGRENVWKWRNLVVSWLHALIVGIWDLSCFYKYPELTYDLIGYHNMYIYAMVAFSTGYFLHDLIDIVVNGQSASMWEVIPHHIAIAGMLFANMYYSHCIAYSVVALLAEVNTIFLHSRKLLQMAGVAFSHTVYQGNAIINLATFVSCRFVCLAWVGYGIIAFRDRVGAGYLIASSAALFVMCAINAVLFWRLLCSDVLGRRRTRPKPNPGRSAANAYRVISDGTIPVSVEDVRLTCCPPTDSMSWISRQSSSSKDDVQSVYSDGRSEQVVLNSGLAFSDCHKRVPIESVFAMTSFQQ